MGASTCASGSQVCSGNSGTLMAKATKNARNSSICSPGVSASLPLPSIAEDARVVERAGAVVEVDDGGQHQHRAGHRVEEELHRRVDAPLVAPDADQEVHGHQRDFPEHVEQEQVLRERTRRPARTPAAAGRRRTPSRGPGWSARRSARRWASGTWRAAISQRLMPSMPTW